MLVLGVLMTGLTVYSFADSYVINAKVAAPLPASAATIDSPADQYHSAVQRITVSGTCPSDTYVQLYQNNVLSGIATCGTNTTTYSLQIDLQPGSNTLEVRIFNITDDEGPRSAPITVWYDPPQPPVSPVTPQAGAGPSTPTQTPAPAAATETPFIITQEDFQYQVYSSGQTVTWTIALRGGVGPYVLGIDWGDDTQSTQTVDDLSNVTLTHTYRPTKDGVTNYTVSITATDKKGQQSFFQTTASVRRVGEPAVATTTNSDRGFLDILNDWLPFLWPIYAVCLLMTFSFWLGERQENYNLLHPHRRRRHV